MNTIRNDLMPVADALQPIYHLLKRASIEYSGSTSLQSDVIERGPHYASIPLQIRTWITKQLRPKGAIAKHKTPKCITTEFVLKQSGRSIYVHIHPLNSTHDPDEMVRLIWIWLQTLDSILAGKGSSLSRTASCSRELHIYLYLTPFLKRWPKANQPKADKPKTESKASPKTESKALSETQPKASPKTESKALTIEEIHVNSGFAFPCSESASGLNHIYVFREEEWFKVLIHETIHAFGVDFSVASDMVDKDTNEAIRALDTAFPGVMAVHNADKNRICMFEAYTECWAEWIAILFRVHEFSKHNYKYIWKTDFVRHLELERQWSMLQASRMRAWYASDLMNMYHAPTPVFAYYMLKSVLMYHCVAFSEWCASHNTNLLVFDPAHIKAFGEFLRDHPRSEERRVGRECRSRGSRHQGKQDSGWRTVWTTALGMRMPRLATVHGWSNRRVAPWTDAGVTPDAT